MCWIDGFCLFFLFLLCLVVLGNFEFYLICDLRELVIKDRGDKERFVIISYIRFVVEGF